MAGFPYIYKVDKTNKFYIKNKVGQSSANDYLTKIINQLNKAQHY